MLRDGEGWKESKKSLVIAANALLKRHNEDKVRQGEILSDFIAELDKKLK